MRRDCMAALLDGGADPEIRSDEGCTALGYVAHSAEIALAQLLLSFEASVHAFDPSNGWTPLHSAAPEEHTARTELLWQHGAKVHALTLTTFSRTPLMLAASNGHVNVLQLLLRSGVDARLSALNGTTALHCAVSG